MNQQRSIDDPRVLIHQQVLIRHRQFVPREIDVLWPLVKQKNILIQEFPQLKNPQGSVSTSC